MNKSTTTSSHRIYSMSFASVYPLYIAKVERKGGRKADVDTIIKWLTGYTEKSLESQLKKEVSFETFFEKAPKLNPNRKLITGVICGIRVEEIQESLMQEIRYLDKVIDELANGKKMEAILRKASPEPVKILNAGFALPPLGAPAERALAQAGIFNMKQVSRYTEQMIASLHGVGPKAIKILQTELKKLDLKFKV